MPTSTPGTRGSRAPCATGRSRMCSSTSTSRTRRSCGRRPASRTSVSSPGGRRTSSSTSTARTTTGSTGNRSVRGGPRAGSDGGFAGEYRPPRAPAGPIPRQSSPPPRGRPSPWPPPPERAAYHPSMPTLRTPDERFRALPGYTFAPHYLTIGGARMHYRDGGRGEPILCLHGEPSWSFLYRKMIPPLAEGHRVIAPDFFGFGKSEKFTERSEYSFQMHRDSLVAFMDQLRLDHIT